MDFSGHLQNLEDAENAQLPTNDKTLSDNELEQAGLVKTSAFVRTRKSKNALRIAKHKDKKAESGIKQLNIEVPEQYRNAIKTIAKSLTSGEPITKEILTLFPVAPSNQPQADKTPKIAPESNKPSLPAECIELGGKAAEIVHAGGLKAFLLRMII